MKAVFIVLFGLYTLLCYPHFNDNQNDEQILESAVKSRFQNPKEALKIYDYLLKNTTPNKTLQLKIKKLEIEILLKNYKNAVELIFAIEENLELQPRPVFEFEFLIAAIPLYHQLSFSSKTEKSFERALLLFENFSDELKQKHQFDIKFIEFEFQKKSPENREKLEDLISDFNKDDERKSWLYYNLGKSYLRENPEIAKTYFIKSAPSGTVSKLAVKASVLKKIAETALPMYSPDFSELTDPYFKDIQKIIVRHNLEFWNTNQNSDSILKYKTVLQELQNAKQLELQEAKVDFTQKTFSRQTETLKNVEKKEKRIKRNLIIFLIIIFLAYVSIRKHNDSLRREKEKQADLKKVVISNKAEEEILLKLKNFENSELFLNKNLRLAGLAKQLETNVRYLSQIINSEKHKSFNAYINSLRIEYILRKLHTDSKYLSFKISYLAEESGFASQSSFNSAFKEETGQTPSVYIKKLSEKSAE